ncbi:MAG: TlpA family protein disulfide reductase [Nitrospirae bacterium]|nr:MAG: TlpA family protein disulfide reductase [Nitrospirota bacterium]
MTKTKITLICFFLIALISAVIAFTDRTPFEKRTPAVGDMAPELFLADKTGKMLSLADYRGKVVLLYFWADWCPPCKEKLTDLQKIYAAYAAKGFDIIAIHIDDVSPRDIEKSGTFFQVIKANERATRDYGNVNDVPVSFLVGKNGRILKKRNRPYEEADLRSDIEKALSSGL